MQMMQGNVDSLYSYPIKGLSAQRLEQATLEAADGFPNDRLFGFARYDSGFNADNPQPLPKDRFLVLVKEERLAGLTTSFCPESCALQISVRGHVVFKQNLTDDAAIREAEMFLATMFGLGENMRPIFANSGKHRFTDVSVVSKKLMNAVSLINLDTVRDFERRIEAKVDPLRFRANVYFKGWAPGSELDLIDKTFRIGTVRFRALLRTRRCAATEVNPATARRDLQTPRLIMQHYGHADMGIYAEVLNGGEIQPGDRILFEEGSA